MVAAIVRYTRPVIIPDLKPMLLAGHACVRIVTSEEPEVLAEVITTAMDLGLEPWGWTAVQGLKKLRLVGEPPVPGTENAAAALVYFEQNVKEPALLITMDLSDHLADARVLRAARETIERFRHEHAAACAMPTAPANGSRPTGSRMVMVDHTDTVPSVIGFLTSRLEIQPPSDAELEQIVRNSLTCMNRTRKIEARMTPPQLRSLVETLRGLSRRQASQLVTEAAMRDWSFTGRDLPKVTDAKRKLLEDTGILEFIDAPTSMDEIGGLVNLKRWLRDRQSAFDPGAAALGVAPPRGLLLLGVQGAGKSLSAKAIATAWRRPLMRLDPGALYDRYIGETEKRLRDALRQAEAMSPLVLWIDEIEKGLAAASGSSTDGGLSRRVFGTMLTWMQEHRSAVFTVATANDIEALPPELLRKGRFDEIFFVDLPSAKVREEIFAIHLRRGRQNVPAFDLPRLAAAAEGFSGAEIEQAVRAALVEEYSRSTEAARAGAKTEAPPGALVLTTERIEAIVRNSPPLSVTMAESIEELRAWAEGRCVRAD